MTLLADLQAILAVMQAAYAGRDDAPQHFYLYAGPASSVAVEQCCEGVLFVAVDQIPLEPGTEQSGGPLVMRPLISVGVLRCAPTMDDEGRPPTAAQHLAATTQVLSDADIMLTAITALGSGPGFSVGDLTDVVWVPVPPEGGCGGGVVAFQLGVTGDC